jgi:hypothetical protein
MMPIGRLLGGLFGGGGSNSHGGFASGNDRSTTTETTTNNQYTDSRQVIDAGGGQVGQGNVWDTSNRSTQNWTQNTDTSNRSTQNWTQNTDTSNRSSNTNSGNTTNTWTYTDGGAMRALTDLGTVQATTARQVAGDSLTLADRSVERAIGSVERVAVAAGTGVLQAARDALGFAQDAQRASYASSNAALGMAQQGFAGLQELAGDLVDSAQRQATDAAQQSRAAFTAAGDLATGNRTLVLVGIGALALMAFVMVRRA